MDTSGARRRNKRWPEALNREIVAATLKPGASVSVVARQYDVNAHQVFSWRHRYRELEKPPAAPSVASGLVAVTIAQEKLAILLNCGSSGRNASELRLEVGLWLSSSRLQSKRASAYCGVPDAPPY